MKEGFRDKNFGKTIRITLDDGRIWEADTWSIINQCNSIITEYAEQDITMTLRQLYYQLVARDVIPNNIKVYSKLSSLLTDARYNGLIDWSAIEDRIRVPAKPSEWDSVLDLIKSAKYSYRLPRWDGQKYYVELFTEKDALSSVLSPIAKRWHIAFCVNRGYSSASAMYDLSKRVIGQLKAGKKPIILYLGDHDPSGLDMVRDIRERITEFLESGNKYYYPEFEVLPVALTTSQVKQYNPPPNPAKITDPRAKWYFQKFGKTSWEVDALRPDIMITIVESAVRTLVDTLKMDKIKAQEKEDMKKVQEFAETLVPKKKSLEKKPKFTYKADDVPFKLAFMRIVHEDSADGWGNCPICSCCESEDKEDIFTHALDEHEPEDFKQLFIDYAVEEDDSND